MDPFSAEEVGALLDAVTDPNPPSMLTSMEPEAVARWVRGNVAALMLVTHDPDDEDEPFSVDVAVYDRTDEAWSWRSEGGSDWPVAYGTRPPGSRPMLTGFAMGLSETEMLWTGLAPSGVERVRVTLQDGSVVEANVEAVSGAFLLALPYPPPPDDALTGV